MKDTTRSIPVFFACDSGYLPYLSVAIHSLIQNANKDRQYQLYVLHTGVGEVEKERITKLETPHVSISFVDMKAAILPVMSHFSLRDYYTFSIYYRLFIPSLFPHIDKAIYLDCDMVIEGDVANLYDMDIEGYLVAAVRDRIVMDNPTLATYVREHLGIEDAAYFNSGMLLMNLKEFRQCKVEETFVRLITTHSFPTVAPDQDYLNYICQGRVLYLPMAWDLMYSETPYEGEKHIIHYNMFQKPWLYDNVPNGDRFWHYAKEVDFYPEICKIKESYTDQDRLNDAKAAQDMVENAVKITTSDHTFKKVLGQQYKEAIS